MRPHRVQARAHITTPTGGIPNAHNGYIRIFRIRSGRLSTVLANERLRTNNIRVFSCHNCNHFYANTMALEKTIKIKIPYSGKFSRA